ncbi:MAG: HlyD family efflux transporter periplasmic adaptor subunit [Opitutaceae bacterium]|jgi:HlyD family secretion protein
MRCNALLVGAALTTLALAGCGRPANPVWQGYLEGEFVYVASPLAGKLDALAVQKGDRVAAGARLFSIERVSEIASKDQAVAQLGEAEARLADLEKGSRPTEIEALQARLEQARSAAALSSLDLKREENLFHSQAISESEYDHARLTHQENLRVVDELTAELETARLGGRADAIAAARADVEAAKAALARGSWGVDQKTQSAPRAGLVYDTLYREGEYVAAGSPVVALLPPENLKVRFFVPETDFAGLKAGDALSVFISDGAAPIQARISYLSPQAEFSPPVLYNRDNRAKLIFMIEAVFSGRDARDLHPGQPVDVARAGP